MKIKLPSRKMMLASSVMLVSSVLIVGGYSTYKKIAFAAGLSPAAKTMESRLRAIEPVNYEKNMRNLDNLIKDLGIPDSYLTTIGKLLDKKYKPQDIYTAYEFLNQKYGKITELESLLKKRKQGKKWEVIVTEYNSKNAKFTPRNFKPGEVEELLKKLTADDIMIADRISKGNARLFDNVINRKKKGESWNKIKTSLSIVNIEEKINRTTVASNEIGNKIKKYSISSKDVVDGLGIKERTKRSDDEIFKQIKKGIDKDEIMIKALNEKYK